MPINRRNGFVLVEVLPAFLFFTTFLLAGLRMLWLQTRIEEAGWTESLTEDAALHTWQAWELSGEEAALAVMDREASWKIYGFPGQRWIPDTGGEETAPDDFQIIFRREKAYTSDGTRFWILERRSGDGEWEPLQSILHTPFPESGGEGNIP